MPTIKHAQVRRPDILTRVSEYIPEIVSYTEQIMGNGFGCVKLRQPPAPARPRPPARSRPAPPARPRLPGPEHDEGASSTRPIL